MKKRCVRKHWPLVDPVAMAIAGIRKTPDAALDKLRLIELSAIESFARGQASYEDFRTLCDVLNLCETMVDSGIGAEAAQTVADAHAALLDAKARHERTGRLALTGPGLTALRDLFGWHDAQRSAVNRSEYERAIAKTRNRIAGAHPSSKVIA